MKAREASEQQVSRSDTDMGLATTNDRAESEWDVPDVRGE